MIHRRTPFVTILLVFMFSLITAAEPLADGSLRDAADIITEMLRNLGNETTTRSEVELVVYDGLSAHRFAGQLWSLPQGLRRVDLTAPDDVSGIAAVVKGGQAKLLSDLIRGEQQRNFVSIVTLFTIADDLLAPLLLESAWWNEANVASTTMDGRSMYELRVDQTTLTIDAHAMLPLGLSFDGAEDGLGNITIIELDEGALGNIVRFGLGVAAEDFAMEVHFEQLGDIMTPRWVWAQLADIRLEMTVYDVQETSLPEELYVSADMLPIEDERFMISVQQTLDGDFHGAKLTLESLTRDNPYHVEGHIQLGYIYMHLGDWMGARASFEQALLLEPGNLVAANNLAYVYIESGTGIERGITLARTVVERRPSIGAYLDTLGWGLYKAGEYEEALIILSQAVEQGMKQLYPEDMAELLYHYARALQAVGQLDEAREAAIQGVELYPHYTALADFLTEVGQP